MLAIDYQSPKTDGGSLEEPKEFISGEGSSQFEQRDSDAAPAAYEKRLYNFGEDKESDVTSLDLDFEDDALKFDSDSDEDLPDQ